MVRPCLCIIGLVLSHPQAHPEVKKWQNTPFPHYNDLQTLIEGRHAMGERAYRVSLASDDKNDDPSSTEDTEDVDNNPPASQSTNVASQVG